MTPNSRSLQLLRAEGFQAEIVERFNTWSSTRHDLFNVFDVLAVGNGRTVAVQATTSGHVADRRKKLQASPVVALALAAGWQIEIHGWYGARRNWQVRRVKLEASVSDR